MIKFSFLMLDEFIVGVSLIVMDELFECIIEVVCIGIFILMVEQNVWQVFEIVDIGYVFVQGVNCYIDIGKVLMVDFEVCRIFFGG